MAIQDGVDLQPGACITPQSTPQQMAKPEDAPEQVTHLIHAYWIRTTQFQSSPVDTTLLKQGVFLQVLTSIEALVFLLETDTRAGLLVMDQATATSAPMRDLDTGTLGVRLKAMTMIVLADDPTEEEMRACLRAGVIDMFPTQFAMRYLELICKRYFNDQGEPIGDDIQKVSAIDSERSMARAEIDVQFYGTLLRDFFDELPARKKNIEEDWDPNPQQIKQHIHSLKGLAMTFEIHQLAKIAVRIEAATRENSLDAVLLLQLEAEIQSAGFQILRWLQLHNFVAKVSV